MRVLDFIKELEILYGVDALHLPPFTCDGPVNGPPNPYILYRADLARGNKGGDQPVFSKTSGSVWNGDSELQVEYGQVVDLFKQRTDLYALWQAFKVWMGQKPRRKRAKVRPRHAEEAAASGISKKRSSGRNKETPLPPSLCLDLDWNDISSFLGDAPVQLFAFPAEGALSSFAQSSQGFLPDILATASETTPYGTIESDSDSSLPQIPQLVDQWQPFEAPAWNMFALYQQGAPYLLSDADPYPDSVPYEPMGFTVGVGEPAQWQAPVNDYPSYELPNYYSYPNYSGL
ncbi:hypothetical protein C8Q80DRAFT_1118579 [Daedaleopsis nitida]|nr:hypothetical protein C8Q80DRAFT_1118579 [Daedaleopsis nitida]